MSDEPRTKAYAAATLASLLRDQAETRALRRRDTGVSRATLAPATEDRTGEDEIVTSAFQRTTRDEAEPRENPSSSPRSSRRTGRRDGTKPKPAASLPAPATVVAPARSSGLPSRRAFSQHHGLRLAVCVGLSLFTVIASLWLARPSPPSANADAARSGGSAVEAVAPASSAIEPAHDQVSQQTASAQLAAGAEPPAQPVREEGRPNSKVASKRMAQPPVGPSPLDAARQLRAGEYAAALTSYRALQAQHPERDVFALLTQLLERRSARACRSFGQTGAPCEPRP